MNVWKSCIFCALFGLFGASPVLAESIVGAWTISAETQAHGSFVLVFLANGYYFVIGNAKETDAPEGVDGFERGTYTWDQATGAATFTTLLDTDGENGLSDVNGAAGVTIVVAGNSATATFPGAGTLVLNRVTGSSPLVGAWLLGDATVADHSWLIVFLPNGVYFMAVDAPPGDPSGPDGMEHGTYAWDPVTGAITSSRTPAPYVDTNGSWGRSDPNAPLILHVSADGQSLTVIEGPDQYAASRIGAANSQVFQINAGLNDTWKNPATPRQGFFITVFADRPEPLMFLAWFTYDAERPAADVTAILGDPGHRWLTALGAYSDDSAALDIELTKGGIFDSGVPFPDQTAGYGTITVKFTSCTAGEITYDIPSVPLSGTVPITRAANDNVALCETLAAQAAQQTR